MVNCHRISIVCVAIALVSGAATAEAQEKVAWTRWDHSTGAFILEGNGWTEYQGGKPKYYFKEASRTGNSVELYDASRQMTIRLTSDKMYWKQPNTDWNYLYNGSPKVGWTRWDYITGVFVREGNGWTEYQGSQPKYKFNEVRRTGNSVELYDASRQMTIRLTSDKMYWKQPGTNWNWLYNGTASQ